MALTRMTLRLYFGDLVFGPGKADLLQAISEEGSISAAGRRMGMSYKRAWSLVEEMNAMFGYEMSIYRSEPFFLELMPSNIDKAQSLKKLLLYTGNSREEMIACGDGFNDLSMIKFAGMGVAMANAQPAVKDASDYITLSNEEDGVAHVVELFLN